MLGSSISVSRFLMMVTGWITRTRVHEICFVCAHALFHYSFM